MHLNILSVPPAVSAPQTQISLVMAADSSLAGCPFLLAAPSLTVCVCVCVSGAGRIIY